MGIREGGMMMKHPDKIALFDVVGAIMQEPDSRRLLGEVIAGVPMLAKHGEIGGGHTESRVDNIKSAGGTSAIYQIARLKRDRPDIVERLERGEFRSVRAS